MFIVDTGLSPTFIHILLVRVKFKYARYNINHSRTRTFMLVFSSRAFFFSFSLSRLASQKVLRLAGLMDQYLDNLVRHGLFTISIYKKKKFLSIL